MGGFRIGGPVCQARSWYGIDDGTLVRSTSAAPGPLLAIPTVTPKPALVITEEDKAEFKLLKGKIPDPDVNAYVQHRTEFFGSTAAYLKFAEESDRELNETKGLRKLIELKGETQTVFYRWVRKAYLNAGVTDVPGLIKRGTSEKLRDALAKVKVSYGHAFKAGGFNPRPMKSAQYRYRLGTISEHGLGKAIDVEHETNPILSAKEWKFIEELAGKTVKRDLARWNANPEALWKDIQDLNDRFVATVASEVKRLNAEAEAKAKAAASANPPAAKTAPKPADPLEVVLAKHPKLKKWATGFFTLEWALVKELHAHDFRWGASFTSSVDLHHFELAA